LLLDMTQGLQGGIESATRDDKQGEAE